MPPPPGVSDDQWIGVIEIRKHKRAPLTARAYQLLCGKLASLTDEAWSPGRLVDLMIERHWIGIERDWLPDQGRPSGPIESRRRFHERASGWDSIGLPKNLEPASLDDDWPFAGFIRGNGMFNAAAAEVREERQRERLTGTIIENDIGGPQ